MKQKCKGLLIAMTVMLLSVGCSEAELEEREFPMLVGVGQEDRKVSFQVDLSEGEEKGKLSTAVKKTSFKKCIETYEERLSKQADYNHLKVLVMEEDLIQKKKSYYEMLDYLAENETFPRNTYVCVVDDLDDLFELGESLSSDFGAYLEEYIRKHEENKSHILTLGDLIDERKNETMIVYIPYLEVEENYLEWKGYVNILGEIWQDF